MRRLVLMAAWTLAAALCSSSQAQSSYTFSDLGVLNPASSYSVGLGINNSGQVSLLSRPAAGTVRVCRITPTGAFPNQVWLNESAGVNLQIQPLPLPAGYTYSNGWAGNINAAGMVTGTTLPAANTSPQRAVVWAADGTPTLLTSTNQSGSGLSLNDNGDVAGARNSGGNAAAPFLWQFSGGSYSSVQLSKSAAHALAVNNLRQVVGQNYLWLPAAAYGLPKGLNTLTGINIEVGKNINNAGIIAGASTAGGLCLRAPVATFGLSAGYNHLGLGGWDAVFPSGLNNPASGLPLRVVGTSQAAGADYAFVWDSSSGSMSDLNALTVNLPAGCVLKAARGINDLGQIVGYGTFNGTTRGFVLTPQ